MHVTATQFFLIPNSIAHSFHSRTTIMPPRLSLLRSTHAILARPSPLVTPKAATPCVLRCAIRGFADSEKSPLKSNGPNQYVLPRASEEAATLGEVMGKGGPEIKPAQEVGQLDSPYQIFDFSKRYLIYSEFLLISISQILKR